VPLVTIKELAGHRSIETTTRYLHLSSAAPRAAVQAPEAFDARGDVGETEGGTQENVK